jgi:molybdopterin synthase sulfur carrier subunit
MASIFSMRVKLYATLRAIVGEPVVELDLPEGATARDLVGELVRRWPDTEAHVLADGRIARKVNVLVDGRNIRWLPDGEKTVLDPGCKVDVFPPAAGG